MPSLFQPSAVTATKANAGGVSVLIAILVLYVLNKIPFIAAMPELEKSALQTLVAIGVGWLCVYFAPPNKAIVQLTPNPEPGTRNLEGVLTP